MTDPLGHATTCTYDADCHQLTATDANGHTTTFAHDLRGRQTGVTYADGTTTQSAYDGAGRLLTAMDQAGKKTAYSYDADGHLLSVTDPLQHAVTYAYDQTGNLTAITDANGYTTAFAYDSLSRQVKKTWPDDSYEAFGYDAVGNQTSHRLADGNRNEPRKGVEGEQYESRTPLAGLERRRRTRRAGPRQSHQRAGRCGPTGPGDRSGPRRPPYTPAAHAAGYQGGDSVSLLVERFNHGGLASLQIAAGRGRTAQYTAAQRERILQELQRAPDRQADGTAAWSLKTLERALRQEALRRVSASTIRMVLHEAGYRFGKTRTWCPTGTAVRQRHGGSITVQDPKAGGKST